MSRREQWRLLLLVMSLGLVLFVMRELRRPENSDRLEKAFSDMPPASSAAKDEAPTTSQPDRAATDFNPQLLLNPELLDGIQDNSYFRNAEKRPWFELIARLQQTPGETLERLSTGEVSYVQLTDQPTAYRGRLVTVRGMARQVTAQKPAENGLGVESYYRVVIQPSGGGIGPIFVYALELPPDLPLGEGIVVDITTTGFFFKNLSYNWGEGLGIAPIILSKRVWLAGGESGSQSSSKSPRMPTDVDPWEGVAIAPPENLQPAVPELKEMLTLAGWDSERFAKFAQDQPLTDDERAELLELLWRVRTFDAASIEAWAKSGATVAQILEEPISRQGEMTELAGRVVKAIRHELPAKDADRFEFPAYYACDVKTAHGLIAVFATRVPRDWEELQPLDEPVTVAGVFVKRLSAKEGEPSALFVAKRIAWHPDQAKNESDVISLGESILGSLGMDVGRLDDVRSRGAMRAQERESFYQMLDAVGRIGANQLVRLAKGNLDTTRAAWEEELRTTSDARRRLLAEEVIRRADEGRYSVAPLFNDAERQIGQLIVVDGTARRIVRIEVNSRVDKGRASDITGRFGIDHYYEMQIFTDDSQNYPLVFCVRELPAGLPMGGDLHVPVRVAGFFFKDWLYRTSHPADARNRGEGGQQQQYAPLLIGRAPIQLDVQPGDGGVGRWVGAGLFLLAFAGIWAAAWWFARDDRKFDERTRARFSLPEGQSLNELKLTTPDEPMKT